MFELATPLVYQYAIGGLVFAVGLVYAWRQGYVGLRGRALRNLALLLGGFFFLLVLQGYLQLGPMDSAPATPSSEVGYERGARLGEPLDYGIMITYFAVILAVGTWFGRRQKSTGDFFFGGQRFSWWLIAASLVATTIGSYSFVKYSQIAFQHGLASSQTYLNDWFWMPLFLFGWLPILYFSRVTSIPEYFDRRFGPTARKVVTYLLLLYMIGYVGVNLFTMGRALNILLGMDVIWAAAMVAAISATYVTVGGQTSVIMTDLLQGVMLLIAGLALVWLGVEAMGGAEAFWEHLPRDHRRAFVGFNDDPAYNSVGIFWQDAMANSAMFFFLNQGILMRFMAARSVAEGRKAALMVPVILMPIAAVVVASGGWVGKALEVAGLMPQGMDPKEVFFNAAHFLSQPGFFGLIMAALTAALMSTVDTLVTAISAIVVNDIYKPSLRPDATDAQQLTVARWSALGVMVLGVALVPVFQSFDSIYAAHGAFTAAVTPPLVVALLLGVFWRRFTTAAAVWTLVGGMVAVIASLIYPQLITPFAHGVPAAEVGDGLFAGARQYKFMRAFYGIVVSAAIGVTVTLMTRPRPFERLRGLVWGTIPDALRAYKGAPGDEDEGAWLDARPIALETLPPRQPGDPFASAHLSPQLARASGADVGDLLFISDRRWWLGGLRASHARVTAINDRLDGLSVGLDPELHDTLIPRARADHPLRIMVVYGAARPPAPSPDAASP